MADKIITEIKEKQISGSLAVVQVGDDPVSTLYVKKKCEMATELGIDFELVKLPTDIAQNELIKKIDRLSLDPKIRGILVQMPLPSEIDRNIISAQINPKKDVDGFHYILEGSKESPIPPTVLAIDGIIDFYKIEKENKNIVIVGGGFLVGKPLCNFWSNQGLKVSILEKDAPDYENKVFGADIIVISTAGGRVFDQSNFKSGATVIDASTVSENGKTHGDVLLEGWPEDKNLAPIPGGIGPLTVAMLYKNFSDLKHQD